MVDPDADPETARLWRGLEREALGDLARWSKIALDTDVEARQTLLAERTGALIAAAFDNAVEPLALGASERAALVARFTDLLIALEGDSAGRPTETSTAARCCRLARNAASSD